MSDHTSTTTSTTRGKYKAQRFDLSRASDTKDNKGIIQGRNSLTPRPGPYTERVEKGGFIGFRKLPDGTGTWSVRFNGKWYKIEVADATDYKAAISAARVKFDALRGGKSKQETGSRTIAELCQIYKDPASTKSESERASDDWSTLKRYVVSADLGKVRANALTVKVLKAWLAWLAKQIPAGKTSGTLSRDTQRDVYKTLRTVLNKAAEDEEIAVYPWHVVDVKSIKGTVSDEPNRAPARSEIFIDFPTRRRAIDASRAFSPALGDFVFSLWITGARTIEHVRMKVRDIDPTANDGQGIVKLYSRKGGEFGWRDRDFPMYDDQVRAFWLRMVTNADGTRKDDDEFVFVREDGSPWQRPDKDFRDACRLAGLPDYVQLYCARHTLIASYLNDNVPIQSVCTIFGNGLSSLPTYTKALPKEINRQLAERGMLV